MINDKFIWDENKNTSPNQKNFKQEEIVKCDITNETKSELKKEILKVTTKISGIYKITHKETGKYYVGSTVNFVKRWNAHKTALERNCHNNFYLQNAWNKYGSDSFEFQIVEYVDNVHGRHNNRLLEVEQKYLDIAKYDKDLKINSHYNICYDANSPNLGRKFSEITRLKISNSSKNRKCSEKTKKLLSELAKIRYQDDTQRKKISNSLKGHFVSEETKLKIKIARKKQIITQDTKTLLSNQRKGKNNPSYDHNIYHWFNKKTNETFISTRDVFIKNFNLHSGAICLLIKNKLKHFKGWIILK